jgi:hypothetical protein
MGVDVIEGGEHLVGLDVHQDQGVRVEQLHGEQVSSPPAWLLLVARGAGWSRRLRLMGARACPQSGCRVGGHQ